MAGMDGKWNFYRLGTFETEEGRKHTLREKEYQKALMANAGTLLFRYIALNL
jgi:hypothetical protein